MWLSTPEGLVPGDMALEQGHRGCEGRDSPSSAQRDSGGDAAVRRRGEAPGDADGSNADVRAGGSPRLDEHADGCGRAGGGAGVIQRVRRAAAGGDATDDGSSLHRPAPQRAEQPLPLHRRHERRPLLRPAAGALHPARQRHAGHR